MNLLFRMIYVLLAGLFRERLTPGNYVSVLYLRVLPNDLDLNFHMNNGRYLTICDLNRLDLFARSGLLKAMFRNRWIPVLAEHTMNYKKPLRPFERYQVRLEVTHWDEKFVYMQHTFSSKHGRIIAEGTSKGCVYSRSTGVIKVDDALAAAHRKPAGS